MRRVVAGLVVVLVTLLFTSAVARADWDLDPANPDWKMHYPQLPDLTPTGLDVLDTPSYPGPTAPIQKMLADDFLCTESGPIRDIHIWGSWNFDQEEPALQFQLAIYKDIPAAAGGPDYSMPDILAGPLWATGPLTAVARPYATGPEQFYDPNTGEIIGQDTVCWQYNFFFKDTEAFVQEKGTIYWLAVQALYPAAYPSLSWGWKTTNPLETDHFNDDAVYIDFGPDGQMIELPKELRYPFGHEFETQSIDLAFVITPEPATMGLLGLGLVGLVVRRRKK